MLDEGFEIRPFYFFDLPLPGSPIKGEEVDDGTKGAVHRSRLVVGPNLVTQIVLNVIFCRQLHIRESFEDTGKIRVYRDPPGPTRGDHGMVHGCTDSLE